MSQTSKYVMAIIRIPIEIMEDGTQKTHDELYTIETEPLDKLPIRPQQNVEQNGGSQQIQVQEFVSKIELGDKKRKRKITTSFKNRASHARGYTRRNYES